MRTHTLQQEFYLLEQVQNLHFILYTLLSFNYVTYEDL